MSAGTELWISEWRESKLAGVGAKSLVALLNQVRNFEIEDFAVVRRALSSGFGCVVDEHGLDWWELISIRFHEQIALIIRLKKLAAQLATNDKVFVTRPGFHATVLGLLLGKTVECFREAGILSWKSARDD